MSEIDQPSTPQRFGRYILLDRIGAGGMAEVFRALMPGVEGFARQFVVKRILSERARADDFVEMFVQEARICAMLHHPAIVQIYDFGQVGGRYFLAMEHLRGHDLSAMMRRVRERKRFMPASVVAYIGQQVALGLGYAHDLTGPGGKKLNIVHRDVSPSNIMCLRTGGVKLLDFGIAKALGEVHPENTSQGIFKGKLTYMAPERLKNEPADGRLDIWALGCVLWETLVGKRLFQGKSELETLKNVMEMPVPPPSALRPDIPTSLDYVVLRALERDPARRYLTAQAMADDLEQVLQETRHNSKAVPQLLEDLFGPEPNSAELPLPVLPDSVMPNLAGTPPVGVPAVGAAAFSSPSLQSAPPGPVAPAVPRGAESTSVMLRKRARIAWRLGAAILVAGSAFGLLALLGGRGGGGTQMGGGPVGSVAAAPIAEVAPPVSQPAQAVEMDPVAVPDLVPTTPMPVQAALPGRKITPRQAPPRLRLKRGLPIDPFAEARARGLR